MNDLNIVHAAQLAQVVDHGEPRRGPAQGELDLIADGAVAIRDGVIVAVGASERVLSEWGDPAVMTLDASGHALLPGLIECHSHPLFAGSRHQEYQLRLQGASVTEIMAAGGGIWSTVVATREAEEQQLLDGLASAYAKIMAGGVTSLEVKSGYGLDFDKELRQLELLAQSRSLTAMDLTISFLGAHVVPEGTDSESYTNEVERMLEAACAQGIAQFHDVTCEEGLFTPAQAERLLAASRRLGIPTKVHADAWASSRGWATAVAGGAVSAEHLTFTPDEEIREVGEADTIAVLLPQAELIYMTARRANARLLIEQRVPVAIATDYCSSIHATSLALTIGMAAPWFRMTAAEAIVGATLNAAYALGTATERGSIQVGKRGDVTVLAVDHPNELTLAIGQQAIDGVVIGGVPVTTRLGLV